MISDAGSLVSLCANQETKRSSEIGDCLVWTGSLNKDGYGTGYFSHDKLAHRAHWIFVNGQPLETRPLVLHHCDNRACVRLSHLFLGTAGDNVRDMLAKGRQANQSKTHCKNNHCFTPENTYIGAKGQRTCRICQLARQRAHYHRNKRKDRYARI